MKLLEAEPIAAPPAPPDAGGAPDAPAADPAQRNCERCAAPMEPTQDWCLECGTAAPGRLGTRPGWHAASTVVALTLLLVLGAVAASYAALTSDATEVASRPAPPAAAPAPQPPPAVPPAPAPQPEQQAPGDVPEVDPPKGAPSDAQDPVEAGPPAASAPSPAPSGDAGTRDSSDDEASPAGPARIAVAPDAGSVYDPYGNAVETNAPARALDGEAGTSWLGRAAEDAETMGFGYVVDLDDPAEVRELLLGTKTPGFRVEVYGATSRALPPDVLDERWDRLRTRSDVDSAVGGAPRDGNRNGDGEERIVLGKKAAGKELRHLLLWFTLLPENGPTIRLTEVELRG